MDKIFPTTQDESRTLQGTNLIIPTQDSLNSPEEAKTWADSLIEVCLPDNMTVKEARENGKPHIPWNRLPKQIEEIVHREVNKREQQFTDKQNKLRLDNTDKRLMGTKKCICSGTGWLRDSFPIRHPDFGKVEPCVCTLNRSRYSEYLWEVAGIPETSLYRFNNYVERNKECELARKVTKKWASGTDKPWLILLGNVGTGKTHLAKASVNWIIGRQDMVVYVTTTELISKARSLIDSGKSDEYISHLKQVPYLVIDDLGREYTTDWIKALFYEIIDYRYNRRLNTMFTSNFTLDELESVFDKAVVDRFKDIMLGTLVVMAKSKSMRPEERKFEDLPWDDENEN